MRMSDSLPAWFAVLVQDYPYGPGNWSLIECNSNGILVMLIFDLFRKIYAVESYFGLAVLAKTFMLTCNVIS